MPQYNCSGYSQIGQSYYYPQYHSNAYYPQYVTGTATTNLIQPIWQQWVTTSTATTLYLPTTTNTTQTVWQQWIDYAPSYSPEVVREANERLLAERRQWAAERDVAHVRARVLLGDLLSAEQKAELDHHGRFHVHGSRGRRYCIHAQGQAGNVELLAEDGRSVVGRFCCHPGGGLPDPDAWLAQMLALQDDEDAFLRTANVHWGRRPELAAA